MPRLIALVLLALAGLDGTAPTASALPIPEVCLQYVDPIHMGSYPVCPLS